MAYNYFPTGYQPYYQAQINTPAPNSFQNGTSSIIWVQGEAAAKSYPIAPNTSVPLWDSEANVIYIKSADASGMPSIKTLDYTMRDAVPRNAEIAPQADYATKDEVASLKEEINALKAKLSDRKERKDGK